MAKKNKDWWVAYRARKKAERIAQEQVAQPLFAAEKPKVATQLQSATTKNTTELQSATHATATKGATISKTQPGCTRNYPDAKEIARQVRLELGDIINFPHDDWTRFKDSIIGDPGKLLPIRDEVAEATRKLELQLDCLYATQEKLEAQLQMQPQPESCGVVQPPQEIAQPAATTTATQLQSATEDFNPVKWVSKNWKLALSVIALGALILGNTTFLANEQFDFYRGMGYSAPWAILLAALCEASLLAFSGLASAVKSWRWKLPMYAASILTAAMILGVLGGGVENRSAEKMAASDVVTSLKNRQTSLEALRASAAEDMKGLNPEVYPTKRSELRANIEAWNLELATLDNQISAAKYQVPAKVEQQETILKLQRALMMLWNVLLAGFVGYLVGNKKGAI